MLKLPTWIKQLFNSNISQDYTKKPFEEEILSFKEESEKLIKTIKHSMSLVQDLQIQVIKCLDDADKIKQEMLKNLDSLDDEEMKNLTEKLELTRQKQAKLSLDLEVNQNNLDQTLELWDLKVLRMHKKLEKNESQFSPQQIESIKLELTEVLEYSLNKEAEDITERTERIMHRVHTQVQ